MTALYGISRDRASQVFRSFDPSQFMVYFIDEDDPEQRSADEVNKLAAEVRRAFSDERRIVGVIKGTFAFCQTMLNELDQDLFEALVCVGDIKMLHSLGVTVLDEHWTEGEPQVSFDDLMGVTARLRKGDVVHTIHDGTRGIVARTHGKFAHVLLDGRDRTLVVQRWAVKKEV